MGKNILIIGNGFDLYHRLPTRYTDFLTFSNEWDYFMQQYDNYRNSQIKDKEQKGPDTSLQFTIPLS